VTADDVDYAIDAVRRLFGAPTAATLRAAG
jgi:hypothetical protein